MQSVCKMFEAIRLTMPIFAEGWRVLSSLSRMRAASVTRVPQNTLVGELLGVGVPPSLEFLPAGRPILES